MTYEVGQKILVEATVITPALDCVGDIQIGVGDCEYVSAPAAATRPIDPEPKIIAFSEVKVGDVLRITQQHMDGVLITYTGDVTDIPSRNMFYIGSARAFWIDQVADDSIELISRPEPEPIKVGDTVTVEQVKTLPLGSVVSKEDAWQDIKDRMVSRGGLHNPTDGVSRWDVYDGDTFTVKYLAGVDNTV